MAQAQGGTAGSSVGRGNGSMSAGGGRNSGSGNSGNTRGVGGSLSALGGSATSGNAGNSNVGNSASASTAPGAMRNSMAAAAAAQDTSSSMTAGTDDTSANMGDPMNTTRGTYANAARDAVSTPAGGYSPSSAVANLNAAVSDARANTARSMSNPGGYGYDSGNIGPATARDNTQAQMTSNYAAGFNKGYKGQTDSEAVSNAFGTVGGLSGVGAVTAAGKALGALQTSGLSGDDNDGTQAGIDAGKTAAADNGLGGWGKAATMVATAINPALGAAVGIGSLIGSYVNQRLSNPDAFAGGDAQAKAFGQMARDNGQQANGGVTGMYEAMNARNTTPTAVSTLASNVAAARNTNGFQAAGDYNTQHASSANLGLGDIVK